MDDANKELTNEETSHIDYKQMLEQVEDPSQTG